MPKRPVFFEVPAAFRLWFTKIAKSAAELVIGFMKNGIRHRIDDSRYQIRFTPRRPGSSWSAINIRRIAELASKEIREFRKNAPACSYYQSLPPAYKRMVTWSVVSAKQPATRTRRLARLRQACARRRRLLKCTIDGLAVASLVRQRKDRGRNLDFVALAARK